MPGNCLPHLRPHDSVPPERVVVQEQAGYYVPFHEVFDDELSVYEDRVKLLKYLKFAPQTLANGLVDVDTGLIYRYTPDARGHVRGVRRLFRGRRRSAWELTLAFLVATGIVIGSA